MDVLNRLGKTFFALITRQSKIVMMTFTFVSSVYASDSIFDVLKNSVELISEPNGSYIKFVSYTINGINTPLAKPVEVASYSGRKFINIEEPDATYTGFRYCLVSNDTKIYNQRISSLQICQTILRRTTDFWIFNIKTAEISPDKVGDYTLNILVDNEVKRKVINHSVSNFINIYSIKNSK